MKVLCLLLAFLLAPCLSAKLFSSRTSSRSNVRCSSLPVPSMSASDFLTKMIPYIDQAELAIQDALNEAHSPGGVAVSVVYKNTTIWTKGFGLIDMEDPSKGAPGPNTGFRIGSITKVLTSLMTLILRDSKQLRSLDDDITEYMPEFSVKNPFKTKRGITFRQLMSHMSGLPRESPCQDIFVKGCSLSDSEIYKNLANFELMFPPGQQASYSNLGFGLLGRTLEKITKSKWEESVKKMVFDPLGMTDSGNTFTKDDIKKMALGYYPDGTKADFISIGWESPAGQTYSSVADLGKLMSLVFNTESSYDSKQQILDGETIREWVTQIAYTYSDGTGFGYPWELIPLGNYTLRTKDGAINGYNSEFQMATEIKTGFVFLHSCDNCASHYKITEIGETILQRASEILTANQVPPKQPPASKAMDYTGVFSASAQDAINVTYSKSLLSISDGPYTAFLEWEDEDSFQVTVRGMTVPCHLLHNGLVGARVYFKRSLTGHVTSLTIPGLAYGTEWKKQ